MRKSGIRESEGQRLRMLVEPPLLNSRSEPVSESVTSQASDTFDVPMMYRI